ncbi:hypothetical protein H2248_010352 [Termitomyces sp. 'cryptogamus']|nr:hypothetical protein H2248_010352 [Termitomyces sp. 'cryptogamus']
MLPSLYRYGTGKFGLSQASRSFSTVQIFGNSGAAEFIAAAGSVTSIPKLHGLPEGRTRELNFFRVGAEPGKLILVDAPGYGARGKAEWGALFDKYIETRRELRRVYILFNAKHLLNAYDTRMLIHLSTKLIDDRGIQPFTLQAVITKADCIPGDKVSETIAQLRKDIWEAAPLCLPPIVTSATMSPPFGLDEMRKNIADACGLL